MSRAANYNPPIQWPRVQMPHVREPTPAAVIASTDAMFAQRDRMDLANAMVIVGMLNNVEPVQVPQHTGIRARGIIRYFVLNALQIRLTYNDLNREFYPHIKGEDAASGKMRRDILAVLLSIRSGMGCQDALAIVDKARSLPLQSVGLFIAKQVTNFAEGGTITAVSALGATISFTAAGTQAAALQAGTAPVLHVIGGAAVCTGLSAIGVFLTISAAVAAKTTVGFAVQIGADHWDVFEATWNKDRRILEAIKQNRDPGNNPCPLRERPYARI